MSTQSRTPIICDLCQEPIERRRELFIRGYAFLRMVPRHYLCHVKDLTSQGKHWLWFSTYGSNSLIYKVLFPAMWLFTMFILVQVDNSRIDTGDKILVTLYITLAVLLASAPAIIAYFRFERKLPK